MPIFAEILSVHMKKPSYSLIVAILLIMAAAFSRVVMFPHNFSPIIGMALFGGAIIRDRKLAVLFPILAMFMSDLMFEVSGITKGFWGWGQLVGYGILATITLLAHYLKNWNPARIAASSIASSILFFILSNLSFFLIDNQVYHLYSQDLAGLQQCYIMALPFLRISLLADLVYSGVLFGSYYLINRSILAPRSIA